MQAEFILLFLANLLPTVVVDNNGNGIYDFFEVEENFSIDLTGSVSYAMQGYGNITANIYANVQRVHGQHAFNLDETITIQSSTVAGVSLGRDGFYIRKVVCSSCIRLNYI